MYVKFQGPILCISNLLKIVNINPVMIKFVIKIVNEFYDWISFIKFVEREIWKK